MHVEKPVLLVSDAGAQSELRETLTQGGISRVVTCYASDAVDQARAHSPCCVLVALRHGSEHAALIVNAIKSELSCTCVLLLPSSTGHYVTLAARSNADAVVFEPLDPGELKRIIAHGPLPAVTQAQADAAALPKHVIGYSP